MERVKAAEQVKPKKCAMKQSKYEGNWIGHAPRFS